MKVRQAQAGDAEALSRIVNEIVDQTTVTFTTETKSPRAILAEIKARGAAFQVIEKDGEPVGYATFFPFRTGPGYAYVKEHTIALAPKVRGQGAGRKLMARLEAVAKDDGVRALIAGVSGDNPEGIAFHRALGFREVGHLPEIGYKFDRWLDLILMQKQL